MSKLTPEAFRLLPAVIEACKNARSPRSVLNYMCAADTADPEVKKGLSTDAVVAPLMGVWFEFGSKIDDVCTPAFSSVIRELKNEPPTLTGDDWDSLEGKVAKVLLADQLSRSCFRGTPEAFEYDPIAREIVRELVATDEIAAKNFKKLPAACLYLLPWALAHSEEVSDLRRAVELVDMAIAAYPNFNLFEGRNKQAIAQHLEVLEKFGRYPQRNGQFGREHTDEETAWLADKENLPMWCGGKLPFSSKCFPKAAEVADATGTAVEAGA